MTASPLLSRSTASHANADVQSAFSHPTSVLAHLGLSEGAKVAEFGAGSGFYVLAAAHRVGNSGKVYAIDVQRELLAKISSESSKEHLTNIEILWGDLEQPGGSKLADELVDVVVVANVLFQIEHKESFLAEAARVLKKGGRLLIVDWTESFGGMGPQPGQVVSESMAQQLATAAGFSFEKTLAAGAHHYGLVFVKA